MELVSQGMEAFQAAVADMGLNLDESVSSAVEVWFDLCFSWRRRRVIGLRDPVDIAVKVVADSFAIAPVLDVVPRGRAIDLGTGNSWPGTAVRLLDPLKKVTLVDSRLGACEFMREFLKRSGLDGIEVLESRAEDAARAPELAGKMALVTTRAMAPPGVAIEVASAFLKPEGIAALWLGPSHEGAVDSHSEIRELGLRLVRKHVYTLPFEAGRRVLAAYVRVSPPPKGYPRPLSSIKARPLL